MLWWTLLQLKFGDPAKAAIRLGESKEVNAVEPLLAALKHRRVYVRQVAAWALGEIGDKRALKPLLAGLGETNLGVRKAAALALGELRDERAVAPLLSLLKDTNEAEHKDLHRAVRRAAVQARGEDWMSAP